MLVVALTGGIASGKSFAADEFQRVVPALSRFDSDRCVRRLLAGDQVVIDEVLSRFGEHLLRTDGEGVDRVLLRELVFMDAEARLDLEQILHPRVRQECLAVLDQASTLAAPLFLAEIPLLFESGFQFGQDLNLVVAVTRRTQQKRLAERNGFSHELIQAMLSAQLPMEDKVLRADAVFWNEGPPSVLTAQLQRFLNTLLP